MPQRIINSLDELRTLVGQEVGVSDWFTIDQERIDAFAEVTQDWQWIHSDVARAKKELPQGKTIAHGFLTLSLIGHLLKQAVVFQVQYKSGINYGFNRIRFPATVPAGAEIRGRCSLVSIEEIKDCVQLCWAVTVEVKDLSKPALVAEWLVRYYP